LELILRVLNKKKHRQRREKKVGGGDSAVKGTTLVTKSGRGIKKKVSALKFPR